MLNQNDTLRQHIGQLFDQNREKFINEVMNILEKDTKASNKIDSLLNVKFIDKVDNFTTWISKNNDLLIDSQPIAYPFSDGYNVYEYNAEQERMENSTEHSDPEWLAGNKIYKFIHGLQTKPLDFNTSSEFIYVMFVNLQQTNYYVGQTTKSITDRFYTSNYSHDKKMRLAIKGKLSVYSDFVMGLVNPEDLFVLVLDIKNFEDQLVGKGKKIDIMESFLINKVPQKFTLNNAVGNVKLSDSKINEIEHKLDMFIAENNPYTENDTDNNDLPVDLQELQINENSLLKTIKDDAEKDINPVAGNEQPKGSE